MMSVSRIGFFKNTSVNLKSTAPMSNPCFQGKLQSLACDTVSFTSSKNIVEEPQILRGYVLPLDYEYNVFAHKANAKQLETMNKALESRQDMLIDAYISSNKDGNLPAHGMNAERLKVMNKGLKEFPEVLEAIYTAQNNLKELPAHKYGPSELIAMHRGLKTQPQALARIYSTKDHYGSTLAEFRSEKEIKLLNRYFKALVKSNEINTETKCELLSANKSYLNEANLETLKKLEERLID